ncbi:MAG: hypothetical protein ACFE7R_11850, partial [Candidatus Hodarchaeota archaeon]
MLNRSEVFIVLLLCGLTIFVAPIFLVDPYKTLFMIATTIVFLLLYLWAYRKEGLREYLQILQAFFIASLVFLLQLFWSSGTTIEGIVFNKLVSTLIVVIPIVLLVRFTFKDLDGLYLKRGNLQLGVIIGTVTLLFFSVTAVPASIGLFGGQEVTSDRLLTLFPWIT